VEAAEGGGPVNDLRNGQIVYLRARVASAPNTQWIQPGELVVQLIDSKQQAVSDALHVIEDRRAVLTLPEAVAAVRRLTQ
jgi:hypothetical protein